MRICLSMFCLVKFKSYLDSFPTPKLFRKHFHHHIYIHTYMYICYVGKYIHILKPISPTCIHLFFCFLCLYYLMMTYIRLFICRYLVSFPNMHTHTYIVVCVCVCIYILHTNSKWRWWRLALMLLPRVQGMPCKTQEVINLYKYFSRKRAHTHERSPHSRSSLKNVLRQWTFVALPLPVRHFISTSIFSIFFLFFWQKGSCRLTKYEWL